MPETPRRKPQKARGARAPRTTKPRPPAAAAGRAAAVETLREQADRLGLLDPLDAEPANIFAPGAVRESDT